MKTAFLCLLASIAIAIPARAQSIEGEWQGAVPESGAQRQSSFICRTQAAACVELWIIRRISVSATGWGGFPSRTEF